MLKNGGVMANKPSKIGKMANKWDFSGFFGHNSDIFQYFAKRIFDSSSVIKGASFNVLQDYI